MWYYSRAQNDPEVSNFLEEYNCESGASRLIRANTYRGTELLHTSSFDKDEWTYTEPGTMGEALLNAACGRRKRELTYVGQTEDKEAYFLRINGLVRTGTIVRIWG